MRATPDLLIAVTGAPLHLTVGGRRNPQLGAGIRPRRGNGGHPPHHHRPPRLHRGPRFRPVARPAGQLRPGHRDRLRPAALRTAPHSPRPPASRPSTSRTTTFRCTGWDSPRRQFSDHLVMDVTDGPDVDEFGATAELLYRSTYTVSPRSNHIGLRLGGLLPERQTTAEVLSRGVPVGAIEVPSRDELLVLHRGRGVTAGYPVLAVVTSRSLDVLAPGPARAHHHLPKNHRHRSHRHTPGSVPRAGEAAWNRADRLRAARRRKPTPAGVNLPGSRKLRRMPPRAKPPRRT